MDLKSPHLIPLSESFGLSNLPALATSSFSKFPFYDLSDYIVQVPFLTIWTLAASYWHLPLPPLYLMARISVFALPLPPTSLCVHLSLRSHIYLLLCFRFPNLNLQAYIWLSRLSPLDAPPEPNTHLPVTTSSLGSMCCPLCSLGPWAALPVSLMLSLLAQQQEAWELLLPRPNCQLSVLWMRCTHNILEAERQHMFFLPCQRWHRPCGSATVGWTLRSLSVTCFWAAQLRQFTQFLHLSQHQQPPSWTASPAWS